MAARALPGMQRLYGADWITVDAAYADQLATKVQLIARHEADVIACLPCAREAASELLSEVLVLLAERPDFHVADATVQRPDGTRVRVDQTKPLHTLSRLIQEDVCILQKQGDVHVLTASLLCFPASWTLSEKIGRGLPAIHRPVAEYDADVAKRVQRLFDGVRVGHPIWRANLLRYQNADLYQPHREGDPREIPEESARYERSERQTLWRMPLSDAIVFSIHTTVSAVPDTA